MDTHAQNPLIIVGDTNIDAFYKPQYPELSFFCYETH